jgi:hypothetical protein
MKTSKKRVGKFSDAQEAQFSRETKMKRFKKFIASMMSGVMLVTSLIIPTGNAFARADPAVYTSSPTRGQFKPDSTCIAQGGVAGCGYFQRNADLEGTGVTRVTVPRDNWRLIAQMTGTGRTDSGNFMIQGEGWITYGVEGVGRLGLDPNQVAMILNRDENGNPPWVVARYFPEQAKLKIDVFKITRDAAGRQQVWVSNFTPHHGEHWRAARRYVTESERTNVVKAGYNPFEKFRGYDDDPMFHNIGWGAAQVALSHAMQYHDSVFSLYIETKNRFTQTTSESGNFLRKTVTTTTTGYATPQFYLAMPLNMSPSRNNITPSNFGVICVTGATTCDDEAHVVAAMIALEPLDGGNIPKIEQQLYYNVSTSSSWTTVAFALMTAALTYGAVGMYAAAAGGGATAGSAAIGISAGEAAANVGALYAGSTQLTQGGSLVSPQQGWMGSVGWDPSGVSNGSSTGASCTNEHCAGLYAAIQQRHVNTDVLDASSGGNLQATNQMVQGNCDPTWTIAQCRAAGLNAGTALYRPDSYIEAKTAYAMKMREQDCKTQGLTGKELRQCISPPIRRP